MAEPQVDRDKLLTALRRLRPEELFYILEEAITLLPQAERLGLSKRHLNVSTLMVDGKPKEDTTWIAEYCRFLKHCVAEENKGDPGVVREAFDILFGLVDHIDQCFDEVLFFADDGGSWQFGEDWHEILPPWFRVLSATAAPEEYAERVLAMLKTRCDFGRDKMLVAARKAASPERRKVLAAFEAREKARQGESGNR